MLFGARRAVNPDETPPAILDAAAWVIRADRVTSAPGSIRYHDLTGNGNDWTGTSTVVQNTSLAMSGTAEVFIVQRRNDDPSPTTAASGLWVMGGSGLATHYNYTDGSIYDDFGINSRRVVGDPVQPLTTTHCYSVRTDGSFWEACINGTPIYSSVPSLGDPYAGSFPGTLQLFTSLGSLNFLADFFEMVGFKRYATADERTMLHSYFSTRYGY